MTIRITCINKNMGNHENRHVAISDLGWVEDGKVDFNKSSREVIYDWIKNKNGQAYVRDSYGNIAWVGTAETAGGTKYVRTYRDGTWTDNLLALSECS